MKITKLKIGDKQFSVRKLSDEDKRKVRETIADQLAAGELSLGEGVRLMRLAIGMTQVQYAKMVRLDLRVLADVEKGEGNPRLDTLEKLAKPYGLKVSFVKPVVRSE
jgi:ribosome-binding protein aMBF1 (putative translation factor)